MTCPIHVPQDSALLLLDVIHVIRRTPFAAVHDQKGSTGRDNRMFVEGVLWIVRTGSPWRDLPEAFGEWNSVFRRFSRWSLKGVWWRIFEAMSDDPDFESLIVDSTIVRAHQHAAGAV